ncbi:aminoglycoside phosphotransferase family protein [Luteimicrobium subarcticum]|uniref:Aminoglycoside phosphotransferase (APT) family kinase protein n=1 Tax=Luteimicrobium subarcticum TaxID=620910 RepID=A0A2M8W442_9MICO|nr:aminoglycoside phosphotransferase family protein [Luteimicrobium subarcticum]PJI85694.1 aminoglycoside phosphotransferase (APT) family kinase protein [Luteimicrobium subarcticum]
MEADIEITTGLAHALLRAQHADLADRPLRVVANGWDTVVMRLGDDLALRLPRREVAAHLVEHEQAVLPVLAPTLPVPVPLPVRVGRPTDGYPYPWSVVPWFDGVAAAATPVPERSAWAAHLANTLAALHTPAPADAPPNPYRGVPLAERTEVFRERLEIVPDRDARHLSQIWDTGLDAAPYDDVPRWLHGDPHPANLVVRPGAPDRLAALVDFGDVTSGDPASDLATAWLTFDAAGRASFRAVYDDVHGGDGPRWVRARAWAASFALVMLAFPDEHPLLAGVGEHAVGELLAG